MDTSNVTTKRCQSCKNEYPLDERHFTPSRLSFDGFVRICKNCSSLKYTGKPIVRWPPVPDGYRICIRCKAARPDSVEFFPSFNKRGRTIGVCTSCLAEAESKSRLPASATKRCRECGNDYPADTRYFAKAAAGRDGLTRMCKNCRSIRNYGRPMIQWPPDAPTQLYQVKCRICGRVFGAKHPNAQLCSDECRAEDNRRSSREEMRQRRSDPEYHALDNERHRERETQNRRADPAFQLRQAQRDERKFTKSISRLWTILSRLCKKADVENRKAEREAERQAKRDYKRSTEYLEMKAEERRAKKRKKNQAYYAVHPEKMRTYRKNSKKRYPEKERERRRLKGMKQRARKQGQASDFHRSEWRIALEYFEGRCAYCGNPPLPV